MIVATAGHVDHGKTLLVRALTGVDTDRLPEEKARAMTIDLGFAYWPTPTGERVGFVDVPGHERFVRNMLCGVAAIDFVLLVVAADDGPMPQTREHLAILSLLGVGRGALVVTKTDRVEPGRVATVTGAMRALLAATPLAGIPAFPVSAVTGEGIAALADHLADAARTTAARRGAGNFRLAVDRAFTVAGAGLVVTGTAFAGHVALGDGLRLLSSAAPVRVRALRVHDRPAERGGAGQRIALNLAGGIEKADVTRGDWIIGDGVPPPVARFDGEIWILAAEKGPFAHWTPVHLHLGAAETVGRVALLEDEAIAPGDAGLAQFRLDHRIGAVHGDRFILRDQSGQRTLGGGRVIDIAPPARGRARPERIALLRALGADHAASALAAALDRAPSGLDVDRFARGRNLSAAETDALLAAVPMRLVGSAPARHAFSPAHWDAAQRTLVAAVEAHHRRHPELQGVATNRVFSGTGVRLPPALVEAVAGALAADGVLVKEGNAIRSPEHRPKMEPADAARWAVIRPLLEAGGSVPPTVAEIAERIGERADRVLQLLVRAGRHGLVIRVADNRFYRPGALQRLADLLPAVAAEEPERRITVARFRDRSGVGRNLAIELLEFFDRVRLTQRKGDFRILTRAPKAMFERGETPV